MFYKKDLERTTKLDWQFIDLLGTVYFNVST